MLAYDLYLKNKNYDFEYVKPELIKKIFVQKDLQTNEVAFHIDNTQLSVYGISESDKSIFQRIFQMPEKNKIKLPYRATGSNSPKPYLEIKGEFKNKDNTIEFHLYFPDKNKPIKFTSDLILDIDIENHQLKDVKEIINVINNKINAKINKTDYYIEEEEKEKELSIYDLYKNYNIITNDSLQSDIFEKIVKEFFSFIKNKWTIDLFNKNQKGINFSLIILPTQKEIKYRVFTKKEKATKMGENKVVDSFGNETSGFPSETTQTAKFLSFDDPAFALNCKEKDEFYRNLSIGRDSLKFVNIASDDVFNISGLNWIFTDLDDPNFKFHNSKKGIYYQLFSNFKDLRQSSGDSYKRQSLMKIICFDKNQAKLEILLNENLTMKSLKKMFLYFEEENSQKKIPDFALEVLIETIKKSNGTKVIWSTYLDAVQSLIHEKTINSDLILSFFTKQIKSKVFTWLSDVSKSFEIKSFFERSYFCIKVLTNRNQFIQIMNLNEEYAYKIGLIAGRYVKYKKAVNEESSSLKDILTYSKYDREKLRFVFQRVGLGINLSNSDDSALNNLLSFIKNHQPSFEITNDDAYKDFSYFFYKGVFQELY